MTFTLAGATPTNTPIVTNTPTRTPTPTATPLVTNTPTRTSTPSAPVFSNAQFTYDGDGKRVKSVMTTTISTTTTFFVGAHYEVANGVVTKYYYAGAQRIAMRTNGNLFYLLGDHLGSTSLTTDANGIVVSEMRYKAWGETRYASGTTPTQYQYTGQYSYTAEFGLYFYNARWYDPYLSRFAQADSIMPPGIQGLDRYAYANNSPVNYIDPSGHIIQKALYFEGDGPLPMASYGVFVEGNLSSSTLLAVSTAVREIAKALGEANGKDSVSSFKEKFGGNVGVRSWASDGCDCAADVWVNPDKRRYEIRIFNANWAARHPKLFVHEFGHIYYNLHHEKFTPVTHLLRRPDYGDEDNGYYGFGGGRFEWQYAVVNLDLDTEIFADMFLGWVYDNWNFKAPGYRGQARKDYMNVNMSSFVTGGIYDK